MRPPRVLVVDDNAMNIELVTFVLAAAGFRLETEPHSLNVVESALAFQPDLILMDIQMPGLDGLELTRRLKADERTRHIVILAFTAYAMKGDEQRMVAVGCDGYISKPIEVGTFVQTVRKFLPPPS